MVLVDTSVWIRFLTNRAPYAAELDLLLERDEVAGHDLIHGELLIGDSGGRGEFLRCYKAIHRLAPVPHDEVVAFVRAHGLHDRSSSRPARRAGVAFVRAHGLHGRGIGWVDAHLLASALVANLPLWTADQRLAGLAGELGAGYFVKARE